MHVKPRIFGLDSIRSIAIILVLISHTRPLLVSIFPAFNGVTIYGFFGVELFFVLSGFLIGNILIKTFEQEITFKSLRRFWVRRWFRTLPNYYLFLGVNLLIFFFFDTNGIFNWLQLPVYVLFLQNLAWNESLFYSISRSLCIEEWFYLLYPLQVIFINTVFKPSIKKSFFWATLFFILAPLIFRSYLALSTHLVFVDIREIVFSRLDAMMTGVLIGMLKYYHPSFNKLLTKPLFAVAVILVTYTGYHLIYGNLESFFSKTIFLNLVTIGFALLLPFSEKLSSSKRSLFIIIVEKISLWSYSLYFVNLPVRYLIIFTGKYFKINSVADTLVLTIIFIAISFFISRFLFRYFESFFLKFRDKHYKQTSMTRNQPLSSDKLVNLSL